MRSKSLTGHREQGSHYTCSQKNKIIYKNKKCAMHQVQLRPSLPSESTEKVTDFPSCGGKKNLLVKTTRLWESPWLISHLPEEIQTCVSFSKEHPNIRKELKSH